MKPADWIMPSHVVVRLRSGRKLHKSYRTDPMTFCGRSSWHKGQIDRVTVDPEERQDVADLCSTCFRNFY
jgi:hypothetical protein